MNLEKYKETTLQHVKKVKEYMRSFINNLILRSESHDATKLGTIEAPLFAQHTEKLSQIEFGSEEYKAELEALRPALEHHYKYNDHHPEYYKHGINDMNLLAILEMLADWQASSERAKNGDIYKSIEINAKRFNIDDQLKQILINTVKIFDSL